MARWYNYAIARFVANEARDERLNVGLIIFNDNMLDIRPARNLDKIRAISAALDPEEMRSALINLEYLDVQIRKSADAGPEDRLQILKGFCAFDLSEMGKFEAHSPATYEHAALSLLAKLVEPEPAPLRKSARRSKLLTSLKNAFKDEGILARRGEDLSAHRIVSGWPLAEGLSADLMLKNGSMHVIETVDAQSDDTSRRKIISDIGISALVLEQARMLFGNDGIQGRLVYSASPANEEMVKPSLRAAEHQGAELINWASADDRRRFIVDFTKLATPISSPKAAIANVNASSQRKLMLN